MENQIFDMEEYLERSDKIINFFKGIVQDSIEILTHQTAQLHRVRNSGGKLVFAVFSEKYVVLGIKDLREYIRENIKNVAEMEARKEAIIKKYNELHTKRNGGLPIHSDTSESG